MTRHLVPPQEFTQRSLGQAVPLVPVYELRARPAGSPRPCWRLREDWPPAAFEVAAFVDFENRAGTTEIATLSPKRDGLKNDGHLLRT